MLSGNTLLFVCIVGLSLLPSSIRSHADGNHPIAKLIRGTFATYDDNGDEYARLYICKASGGRYYASMIRTNNDLENYMIGHGTFTKLNIDYDTNTIPDIGWFHQRHGHAREVTPIMDVANLCDHKELTFSFRWESQDISMDFVKISVKDELLGNDDLKGYQCAIPWDGDFAQEDEYPFALKSDAFSWSLAGWSDAGCWSYVLPDGSSPGAGYGYFFQRVVYGDGASWTMQWDDQTLSHKDACRRGSELTVRGFQCSNGVEGAGFLLYKSADYDTCPILPSLVRV
eukprot:CAMPEP_0197032886 /NCGR_PEP_ID=MMETSP1384-20130603/11436_1 /TAXON_ID=29189 /ORGANISM="Ammonia sp." /LENGTH=284 /DNA_ID=CAMNT_0042462603 /DNA_START=11 /DNA_END=865 /DNA_ORIENTATION=+